MSELQQTINVIRDQLANMALADSYTVRLSPVTAQRLVNALAAMTARAEAAEAKLAHALGADKPNKPATPTERARHWAIIASEEKRRAEAAEARIVELERQLAQEAQP